MSLKFIDLFAGLGGFHLALSKLGHKCVFACELREDLQKQYKVNFPDTPIAGDITRISPKDVPHHDILCAGFPCQPFSQAGKREGFSDSEGRGNLFDYICGIIGEHHPTYILLENVANLKGHDEKRTWTTIKSKLENLNYYVADPEILSPHQFGIPQHRRRIYIVCINRQLGNLDGFSFPKPNNRLCDISKIIDPNATDIVKIKPDTRRQLEVWQEFIDLTIEHGHQIPTFPIWAMEFGATYKYEEMAPAFQTPQELLGKKGNLGKEIRGVSFKDCIRQLPIYAQTDKTVVFPHWKIRYIQQNREFYSKNESWLKPWLKKVANYDNSHLKMEWNCGKDATPTIEDKIVQFRASGIRIKLPTFSPALNLVGTQIPIFPWAKLPQSIIEKGEPHKGRYMTLYEAAKLQGLHELQFNELSTSRAFEALGNAVNATIVKHIAKNLINR